MTFIAKRAVQLLLVVIAVTALTYFSQNLLPGDPAITICGTAGEACVKEYRVKLHLDDPAVVRYFRWLGGAVTGDLGKSANTNQEVRDALGERAPVTFALVVYSQLIALLVAIPVGLLAAQKVGTYFDRGSTGCAFGLLAVPAFIAAPPLVALFAVKLHWFNATGYAGLELWVLLLQIIFFAAAIPATIYVSQAVGPLLGRYAEATRILLCAELAFAASLVSMAVVSAITTLANVSTGTMPGISIILGFNISVIQFIVALVVGIGLFAWLYMRAGSDDAAGPATVAILLGIVFVFGRFIMALKNVFPIADDPDNPIAKLVNQGLFDFKGLFLPALVLAIAEMATYMRLLRSDLISTLQEDYITMAKAKGLSPRSVLMKHAFRPSTFSLITVAGLNFGRLIGGTLIVEVFFALPGIGKYLVESMLRRDYLAVQGAIVLITVCYVGVTFILDAVYALIDPRIRHARVVV